MIIDAKLYKNTFAYVRKYIRNNEDANDIAQISIIKAYLNFKKLKDKSKFNSWLYAITKREVYKFKYFKYDPIYNKKISVYYSLAFIDINLILNKLKKEHKKLLSLSMCGYTHREISTLMGIEDSRKMKYYLINKLRGVYAK